MTRSPSPRAPMRWSVILRWALVVLALAFLARALASQWTAVRDTLVQVPVWSVVMSVLLAAAAVAFSGEQQRTLLESLGYRLRVLPWLRVFFMAQLGKYVPGSGWAYVAQMEMSRKKGITRATSVVTMALGAGLTVLTAAVVAATVAGSDGLAWIPLWIQVLVVVGSGLALVVFVARPSLVGRLLQLLPERLRRRGFEDVQVRPLGRPVVWTTLAWVGYGAHLWVIVSPMSDDQPVSFRLVLGTFALAWVVGFLAVFVPAGVGVREAVMVALLAPIVSEAGALAAALLSRFVIVLAEALLLAISPFLASGEEGDRELAPEGPPAT
jgi:uncharacterized membrane protein YbhN (UPF0104 family)